MVNSRLDLGLWANLFRNKIRSLEKLLRRTGSDRLETALRRLHEN